MTMKMLLTFTAIVDSPDPARWSDELSDFSDASLHLSALAKVLLQPCSESRKRELPLCEGDFSKQRVLTVKIGLFAIVHVLTCFESIILYVYLYMMIQYAFNTVRKRYSRVHFSRRDCGTPWDVEASSTGPSGEVSVAVEAGSCHKAT